MNATGPLVVTSTDLSEAWSRAVLEIFDRPKKDVAPLLLSVGGFRAELPDEDHDVREWTDRTLAALGMNSIRVTAMTIFPFEMWCRRGRPAHRNFCQMCVKRLLPRLRSLDQRNRLGTYFGRMMAFSGERKGAIGEIDQLSFVIELLKNKHRRPRQSALQIACFDPMKDLTKQTRRGFPCLQQISIVRGNDRDIAVNAYYPTQYIFDRGYGNYLGLCHLGAFLAHETGLQFSGLNCFVGRPELGTASKKSLRLLVGKLRRRVDQSSNVDGEES